MFFILVTITMALIHSQTCTLSDLIQQIVSLFIPFCSVHGDFCLLLISQKPPGGLLTLECVIVCAGALKWTRIPTVAMFLQQIGLVLKLGWVEKQACGWWGFWAALKNILQTKGTWSANGASATYRTISIAKIGIGKWRIVKGITWTCFGSDVQIRHVCAPQWTCFPCKDWDT